MFAIEARGLEKVYNGLLRRRELRALRGLDLAVPSGTVFGLIGPNGAGKTTFIKSLLGVVRPTSGTVRVFGESPEQPAIRRRIGYLPERLHFAPGVTAVGFLASVARLRGLRRFDDEIHHQLGRVGLAADARRRASTFSTGMKQRLGLAAALLGQPDLLVLDEPTDGIDPIGRSEMRQLLMEENQRGATVFMNSHLLSETERLCARIGVLVQGRVVREGELEALCRAENRWQLRFAANGSEDALTRLGFHPTAEGLWHFAADGPEALNRAIADAQAAGALVLEVTPRIHDLEDILVDAVSGA
jgi:ABC-2 type transport system ATP-binding protein